MLSSRGSSRPRTDPLRTVHFVNSKTLLFSYIISEVGMHLIFSMCVYVLSHVQLFATPCTVARQAPHVISQARILEWVAIPFSRGSSQCRDRTWVSCLKADSLLSESNPNSTLIRDSQYIHFTGKKTEALRVYVTFPKKQERKSRYPLTPKSASPLHCAIPQNNLP